LGEAALELKSPVILAATPGTFNFSGRAYIDAIIKTMAKDFQIPLTLHLDHHEKLDDIKAICRTRMQIGNDRMLLICPLKKIFR